MNLITYLIIGVLFGSIAGRIMGTNSPLGLLVDIIVGAVGAFLAGYFISPPLQLGAIHKAVHHHVADDRPVLDSGQTNRRG